MLLRLAYWCRKEDSHLRRRWKYQQYDRNRNKMDIINDSYAAYHLENRTVEVKKELLSPWYTTRLQTANYGSDKQIIIIATAEK